MARRTRKYAYVCAPRSEPETTAAYCRRLYRLGYMPVSPWVLFRQFMDFSSPDELAVCEQMARALIRRCTVFIVCGPLKTRQMRDENRYAEDMGKHRCTLEGMLMLEGYEQQPLDDTFYGVGDE